VAGFVFSFFLPARSGFVVSCVMVLMFWCCLLREGVVVLLRDISWLVIVLILAGKRDNCFVPIMMCFIF
jgi:hypothetical protein